MDNLILNSQWAPGPSGGPQYFQGMGPITYDSLSINGYRTCSVTIAPPVTAQDFYTVPIDVRGRSGIVWGLTIRAVDASYIALVAEFFDANMTPLRTMEMPVQGQISYEFRPVAAQFPVPQGAGVVRLSTKFMGTVTACTFYAPVAYYA